MDFFTLALDFFLHLDQHISQLTQDYGIWVYLLLFLIVFLETGFVVTPFLPGDSLLFAAGAVAALGALSLSPLFLVLASAAILGNTANYCIGYFTGPRIFRSKSRLLKREYLERAHKYYEKHGGKAIVLTRFIPIARTFAPFVAGIGKMKFWRFTAYNIAGGAGWVAAFLLGGFYFGNLPFVRDNFSLVVAAIVAISFIPLVLDFIHRKNSGRRKSPARSKEEQQGFL